MIVDTTIRDEGPSVWFLKKEGRLLATLVELAKDLPWIYCSLESTSDFEAYRNLFSPGPGERRERVTEIHTAIRNEKITLTTGEGVQVIAFTVVVENDQARLTFSEV